MAAGPGGQRQREDGQDGSDQSIAEQARARLLLHPDYTAAGLWYGITAAALLLLLLEVNGGSEMTCAGWMAGWLEVVNGLMS
jgi:hypothetical protein